MIIQVDIATPNGAALQAAIGAGNVRAWAATDLVGRDRIQQLMGGSPARR